MNNEWTLTCGNRYTTSRPTQASPELGSWGFCSVSVFTTKTSGVQHEIQDVFTVLCGPLQLGPQPSFFCLSPETLLSSITLSPFSCLTVGFEPTVARRLNSVEAEVQRRNQWPLTRPYGLGWGAGLIYMTGEYVGTILDSTAPVCRVPIRGFEQVTAWGKSCIYGRLLNELTSPMTTGTRQNGALGSLLQVKSLLQTTHS
ncbi:uncharacterized protein F4807DRAFT_434424 [Annulohypoxylon truncatum]|uniref:uncharacterized protein n=1 Tax=Annulohypoxylon truncatum TaxID=327061 RepID=UPI0020081630|nr:uncharacterized protein F4807DRAFT_434424 [Annulohypoxylon truncatum]KAI1207392.1 hypothetical protein F4807DRAFT_434424 [Annulohypoxylon truncatum]